MRLFVLLFVVFLIFDQTRSQTIGAFAGASIGEILVPQKDTLSNRIVSFIANQIFASDIVPQLNDVRFYLWTRLNPIYGIQLLINRTDILNLSTFNRFKPVKVLIHGFGGNGTDDRFVSKARDSYLLLADFNVIAVDWSSLAEYPNYARAAVSTTPVGTYVANFLDFLISQDTPPSAFHIIGYSLGAHVAGSAGNALRLGRLPRITGLEPAGGYERIEKLRSLSSNDATFVDVIHTNANILGLGTTNSIGHADFYPNGGRWQYGCIWNTEYDSLIHCSHGRSTHYFIESILAGPGKFLSYRCSNYFRFKFGICDYCQGTEPTDEGNCVFMGEYASPRASGTYFLYTNPTSPYSL